MFRRRDAEKERLEIRRESMVRVCHARNPDGAQISYRYRIPLHEPGRGDIALLGGWTVHPAAYLGQLKTLTKSYRILTMENRGYWGKGRSTIDSYLDDLAGDLLVVMQRERIQRIVIVGHSMWGGVAMKFYHRFPSRVSGLVLVAPAYTDPRKLGFLRDHRMLQRAADTLFYSAGYAGPADIMKRHLLSRNPVVLHAIRASIMLIMEEAENKRHLQKLIKNVLRADVRTMSLSMQALFRMDESLLEKASQIDAPVLLIGGRRDPLISPQSIERLARMIPNAESEIWDVKHFPMLSAPQDFSRRVAAFVDRIS